MELVWLKRDLRIRDHAPLVEASRRGPVLVLYVYEPELLAAPEHDPAHLAFVDGCLAELDEALRARGAWLTTRVGALPEVFEDLYQAHPFRRLWSHEETGLGITYARDKRVKRWARSRGVEWVEIPQFGVFRPHPDRNGWSTAWERRMRPPPRRAPDRLQPAAGVDPEGRRGHRELGLSPSTRPGAQRAGEEAAWQTLRSFLEGRGVDYRSEMSSPVTAWEGCSRLSPYLAYGAMSMRSIHHATGVRIAKLRAEGARAGREARRPRDRFRQSLEAFASRLRWHCHFIQKLEDEPRIEHENVNRAFDGMREQDPFDEAAFDAWREGRTGYPLVDACMRALAETGWVNFRMRAMLVSFACHHLWLHWRRPAVHLARAFLDFEPGIHFSQVQMQAGTTGINALRIYNPTKQLADQDPAGVFVRRWVPELAEVPDRWLPEPAKMPVELQRKVGCRVDLDYPSPIVEHGPAYARARRRLEAWRRRPEVRAAAAEVHRRHGSRKRPARRGLPKRP
jgi:deoxyribodipyrimidine photo-lyase